MLLLKVCSHLLVYREKEKGASGILRGAKPASAQVDKAKSEAEALEAQLREAVEAQRQAEARLKEAQSELRSVPGSS